jgi:hypothetical protein
MGLIGSKLSQFDVPLQKQDEIFKTYGCSEGNYQSYGVLEKLF